jgi:hypothetical protein
MAKLVLLSIMIATIGIPVVVARDPLPWRGFKRALAFFLAFCFCYVLALKYLYVRFLS